jgi:hypothetical protein
LKQMLAAQWFFRVAATSGTYVIVPGVLLGFATTVFVQHSQRQARPQTLMWGQVMKTCAVAVVACIVAGAISTAAAAAIATTTFGVTVYVPFTVSVPQNAEAWLQTGWQAPYSAANSAAAPQMTLTYVAPGLDRMTIAF